MNIDPMVSTLALASAGAALVTDLRWRKIYNWQTLPLLALAPVVRFAVYGWSGLQSSLLGIALAVLALVALVALLGPGMGGGDFKLLVALGGLLGWPLAGWLLLYTGVAGVVVVPFLLSRGIFRYTVENMAVNLVRRRLGERELSVAAGSRGPRLPFAVCILLGTLAAVLRGPLL